MKNMESYRYEQAMFEILNESFQDFQKQQECFSKNKDTLTESQIAREQRRIDEDFDKMIAQKELVEAVIGECVNLQKDGHIRIGVDHPEDYELYLEHLKAECASENAA